MARVVPAVVESATQHLVLDFPVARIERLPRIPVVERIGSVEPINFHKVVTRFPLRGIACRGQGSRRRSAQGTLHELASFHIALTVGSMSV